MIVADTSGLLCLFNRREAAHQRVVASVTGSGDVLVVSPYVVAELGYLAASRLGVEAELTILRELAGGAYELAALDASAVARCADLVEQYADQDIGVTDASLIVLAERHATRTILTLDHRHFDVVRPLGGGHFDLIPS
ncbi:MAG: PIN domain-containing protein [Solirubrobacterales bacterium]